MMIRKLFFALTVSFLLGSFVCADGTKSGSIENAYRAHLIPTIQDGFDRNGLYFIGGTIVLVAVTQNFDYAIRDTWTDHQRMPANVSQVFDYMGQGYFGIPIILGQLVLDQENGIYHSEAFLGTFVTTSLFKFSAGRLRPDGSDKYSMPSGHTSTMFASAAALAYSYGPWVGLPALGLAAATAASRWSDNRHWLSDTVAGAAVGIFWARAASFHHHLGSADSRPDGKRIGAGGAGSINKVPFVWDWSPVFDSETYGLTVNGQF